jgi:hypothetical protein
LAFIKACEDVKESQQLDAFFNLDFNSSLQSVFLNTLQCLRVCGTAFELRVVQ